MELSIVVNHYRSPAALKTALREIANNVSLAHETIVVDSAAQKDTGRLVREFFPDVRYIPFSENVGFAKSVNRGITESQAPYVFIVNADLVIGKKCAESLYALLEREGDVALASPRLRSFDETLQPSAFRYYTPSRIIARRTVFGKTPWGKKILSRFVVQEALREDLAGPLPVDWVMGSAMFVRKSAIEKVGMLDERYFMYFEDVDWCRRFWEAGYKVMYVPYAGAWHLHQRSSKGGPADLFTNPYARIHMSSAVKYFLKFGISAPKHGV